MFNEREVKPMFYVSNDYGILQFTTTNECYASVWCDINGGYYHWK